MTHSLETLSGTPWPDPGPGATALEQRVTEARRVPTSARTAEHLRILLGQRIDLAVVVPIAAARLVAEPMMAGDYYEGDVLEAVLALPEDVWREHPGDRAALADRVRRLRQDDPADVDDELARLIDRFAAAERE